MRCVSVKHGSQRRGPTKERGGCRRVADQRLFLLARFSAASVCVCVCVREREREREGERERERELGLDLRSELKGFRLQQRHRLGQD